MSPSLLVVSLSQLSGWESPLVEAQCGVPSGVLRCGGQGVRHGKCGQSSNEPLGARKTGVKKTKLPTLVEPEFHWGNHGKGGSAKPADSLD